MEQPHGAKSKIDEAYAAKDWQMSMFDASKQMRQLMAIPAGAWRDHIRYDTAGRVLLRVGGRWTRMGQGRFLLEIEEGDFRADCALTAGA